MLVQCVELQRPKFITSAGLVVGPGLKMMSAASGNLQICFFPWYHYYQYLLLKVTHLISCRPNIVYVASNHFVWRLVPVSISSQIQQLLQDKQFELALQLAVSSLPSQTVWP